MRIILAEPPSTTDGLEHTLPSLGILYIISYLREKFNDLNIYYVKGNMNMKQYIEKIKRISPDIYGLSIRSAERGIAYETINSIRKEFSSLPIICGGPHPTADAEEVLNNSQADICIIGEGEATFAELIEYYKDATKKLNDIKGIAYKKSGNISYTPIRPLIKDLDSIPFPAWDVIDFKDYQTTSLVKKNPYASMIVSRGCPYNCVFCSNPVWKANKPWLRLRSPKNIREEVEYLYNMGIREIYLYADEFNSVPKWGIEVCEEIKKLGYDDLFFQTILRVDKVPEALAKSLSDINCWLVKLGIESGNQRALNGINKKITLDQVVNACEMLKKYNIKTYGFFMMFNIWEEGGELCYESEKESLTTLKFARSLLSKKLLDYFSWAFTTPIPGSQLYDICKKHDLILNTGKQIQKFNISVKLPGITEKAMKKIQRKGTMLQTYYYLINGIKEINWKNWRYFLKKFINRIR